MVECKYSRAQPIRNYLAMSIPDRNPLCGVILGLCDTCASCDLAAKRAMGMVTGMASASSDPAITLARNNLEAASTW
jgi:Na+-transporting NADH:ubiquinone oxidoreductase subunit NqrD